MNEIWKDVAGYEGLYQVSNLGRIKSLPKNWETGHNKTLKRSHKGKIMIQSIGRAGYYQLTFSKDQIRKNQAIHRLIAMAFIPNPNNKPFINHKDSNKLNNSLDNLEWCTCQENTKHAYDNGQFDPMPQLRKAQEHQRLHGYSNSKEVLDLSTGIYYTSGKEAYESKEQSIAYSTFKGMLNGSGLNKTTFAYCENL